MMRNSGSIPCPQCRKLDVDSVLRLGKPCSKCNYGDPSAPVRDADGSPEHGYFLDYQDLVLAEVFPAREDLFIRKEDEGKIRKSILLEAEQLPEDETRAIKISDHEEVKAFLEKGPQEGSQKLRLLVRLGNGNKLPITRRDADNLTAAWCLPAEWMERMSGLPVLDSAFCHRRSMKQCEFLHFYSRNLCGSAAIETIVSYNTHLRNIRGVCLFNDLSSMADPGSFQYDVMAYVNDFLERLRRQYRYIDHPLLVPLMLLEKYLLSVSFYSRNLFSQGKKNIYGLLTRIVQTTAMEDVGWDIEGNIKRASLGLYNSRVRLDRMSRDFEEVQLHSAALKTGIAILEDSQPHEQAFILKSEVLHNRVLRFASRCQIAENEVKSNSEVLSDLVAQRNSKMSHSMSLDSKDIALSNRRDSAIMLMIAMVTMFFLPGTAIASLFSTSFLVVREPQDGGKVSPDFWVFWAITAPLTAIVMTIALVWFQWLKLTTSAKSQHPVDTPEEKLSKRSSFGSYLRSISWPKAVPDAEA